MHREKYCDGDAFASRGRCIGKMGDRDDGALTRSNFLEMQYKDCGLLFIER